MRTFVFLLCIGSVLSFPGYNNDVDEYTDYDGDDSSEEHECSHCEFLKGLPKKALSEYYKIAQDTSQSVLAMEKSLERWAKKYNIEDKYKAHVADENKKFEAFKKSLTDLTKKLTAFFKSYIKIGNDKKKSYDTMYKETQELFKGLNKKERGVVCHILHGNFGSSE
ncbi:hypothetical protein KIN20_023784 [Parelaphostrongylus tenuis]|uniref:SXP/RAL-2 family protein Ani s 5-like cation-binding domain-containing protein n=1 Tax=Parelaphostrongylus tenuis TaxID=148309 RepID=A0AAD5QWC0_PARTN|nr:hypothetical protein KIN20_015805 [Parelaphostrongylus tenuis]KAJ1363837.1 hypothetical protein KIN20_023784 [Parelaphostrongylus tenuis]